MDDFLFDGDDFLFDGDDFHFDGDDFLFDRDDFLFDGDDFHFDGDDLLFDGDDLHFDGDDVHFDGDDLHFERDDGGERSASVPCFPVMISIAPIPDRFLQRVRSEGLDDLGQPVKRVVAQGGEPCRDVLRRASAGEELLLASFTPFSKAGPYKEYGPIFVLAHPSGEDVRRDELPAAGGATDYLRDQFVIRAYSAAEEILDAALVKASDLAAATEKFLAAENTAFLHVRFPTYGCFALRIDGGR
jgi:hypothetical protein